MAARESAVEQVLPLLEFLSGQGWVIGFHGVFVDSTGNVTFLVNGSSADLVAAIGSHGLSVPYTVEETDRHGVIYPPA